MPEPAANLSFGTRSTRMACTKWGHKISRHHFPSFPLLIPLCKGFTHLFSIHIISSIGNLYPDGYAQVPRLQPALETGKTQCDCILQRNWIPCWAGKRGWNILGKDTMHSQHKHITHSRICYTQCTVMCMTNTVHMCARGTFTYCTDAFRTQRHKCLGYELEKCKQFAIAMCPCYLLLSNR